MHAQDLPNVPKKLVEVISELVSNYNYDSRKGSGSMFSSDRSGKKHSRFESMSKLSKRLISVDKPTAQQSIDKTSQSNTNNMEGGDPDFDFNENRAVQATSKQSSNVTDKQQ